MMMPVSYAAQIKKSSNAAVTVYLTISSNGDFVTGNDGTVMARVPVSVDYYDLANYGLEKYNKTTNGIAVQRATLLHVLIKATEEHYALRTLTSEDVHSSIIDVTNAPRSMYLKHFWGHEENLMYFVDHKYPLMSPGIGATADYIEVEDGMEIDLGMFTDWSFWKTGAFTYFDNTAKSVATGENVTLTMKGISTSGVDTGTQDTAAVMPNESIRVSSNSGKTWNTNVAATDQNGVCTLKFNKSGTYYVSAGPSFANNSIAAPPISVITVTGNDLAGDAVVGNGSGGSSGAGGTGGAAAAADTHSVAFDSQGGSSVAAQTVTKGAAATIPSAPTRDGYVFGGWYTDAACMTAYDFSTIVSKDVTLFAKWTKSSAAADASEIKADINAIKFNSIKARGQKGKIALSWVTASQKSKVDGYQIYKSTKKSSGFKKIAAVKATKYIAQKGLKKNQAYYFKVRGYKLINGDMIYTNWSKTIRAKIK